MECPATTISARPATPLPPIREDMSSEELPTRCESRMSQRPQLRRCHASYKLPKINSFDQDDDYDDDSDPVFSSAVLYPQAVPFGSPSFYSDHDVDDDEDFGELIRFRLHDAEAQGSSPLPSLPPLPLPQAVEPPCDDFWSIDTPPAYHGFSYHALSLIKCVWNARRAHWSTRTPVSPASSSGSPDPSTAYDGIMVPPHEIDYPMPDDYASPATATPPAESRLAVSNPNVPIYPRLGDMCSLRDGRGAAVDRTFCNFPLYTIRKVLYLHDMLRQSESAVAVGGENDGALQPVSVSEKVARARADEQAVGVLCDQFQRAMVLDAVLPASAKGWTPVCFARWRILLERATGKQVPLGGVPEETAILHTTSREGESPSAIDENETQRFERAPQRPKTPHFFLLDEDDDDDEEPARERRCSGSDSDDDGWDEINLENSPRRRAVAAPVVFFDRRAMPAPMPMSQGIMAY